MAKNRGILAEVKAVASHDMLTVLKNVDQGLLKEAIAGERFSELFFANAEDAAISDYIKSALEA